MNIIRVLRATVAFTLSVYGTAASAAPINLFNTGVDASGVPRPNYSDELHYTIVSAPIGSSIPILRTATSANGFPIGPWLGDTTLSSWTGPRDNFLSGPIGNYIYRTTFSLAPADVATASITGRWLADDNGTEILLNGVSNFTGIVVSNAWTSFNLTNGFVAGLNTIDFKIYNYAAATGLRVEMTGSNVPEPASWAMLIAGFGLTGAAMRRRRVISAIG